MVDERDELEDYFDGEEDTYFITTTSPRSVSNYLHVYIRSIIFVQKYI